MVLAWHEWTSRSRELREHSALPLGAMVQCTLRDVGHCPAVTWKPAQQKQWF